MDVDLPSHTEIQRELRNYDIWMYRGEINSEYRRVSYMLKLNSVGNVTYWSGYITENEKDLAEINKNYLMILNKHLHGGMITHLGFNCAHPCDWFIDDGSDNPATFKNLDFCIKNIRNSVDALYV